MASRVDDFLDQHFAQLGPEERERFRDQLMPPDPMEQYLKQQAAPDGGGGGGGSSPDVYGPYDPNPGSPTYQPNPGIAGKAKETAPRGAVLGAGPPVPVDQRSGFGAAVANAVRSDAPLFQNPLAPTPETDTSPGNGAKPGEIGPPTRPMTFERNGDAEKAAATFAEPSDRTPGGGGVGGGALISKGGRTPHSWQVQQGLELPETVAAYGKADRSAREAAGAARDAGELDAIRQMGYLDKFEQAQNERAMRLKAQQEDRARRIDAELDKYSQMTDAVRGDQIDPSSFFTGHGTAGAFAASLAYMLGAVGGALTHTENPVIGVIRDEIDAQKKNAALRGQKLEDQRGLLGQLTRAFGDENIGEQAAWGAYLEKAKTDMAKIAANSQYDSVRAKYKQAIADIDAHLAPTVGKLEELTQDKVMRQDVNAPAMYAGGATGAAKNDARYLSEAYEKAGVPQLLSELENADRVVDSFGNEDIPGIGLVTGRMPVWMLSERGAAARQAIQGLKNAIGHARFGGALSPGEAERLDTELEGARDANSIRRTIQSVRSALQKRSANIAAGASPEGVDLYEQRGGSVQRGASSERQVSTRKSSTPYVRPPK